MNWIQSAFNTAQSHVTDVGFQMLDLAGQGWGWFAQHGLPVVLTGIAITYGLMAATVAVAMTLRMFGILKPVR